MARKTKEEALLTRNAILDAAESVFQERGVSNTSLAEIATAAGVTRGAVYWHFANKIDLFDAMVQRVFGSMETKREELQATRRYDDPVDLVRELTIYFLDRVANDPRYLRIVDISWHKCEYVGETAKIRDKHFERGNCFLNLSEAAFDESRRIGRLALQTDPRTAAIGLIALVDGLVANWTLDKTSFALVEAGTEIIDSYLAGLRTAGRG